MSTAGAIDLPLDIWGGLVTDMPMANLLEGVSPDCADVKFTLTGVSTRPGLSSLYTAIAGNPTVNYIKSYIDPTNAQHTLFLDSLGELWQEFPQGTVALISAAAAFSSAYAKSTTVFGREYIAIGDGKFGVDIPRQYDGTNFDRVSQVGPGAGPSVQNFLPSSASLAGNTGTLTATIAAAPTGAVRSGSTTVFNPVTHKSVTVSTTVTITTTAAHGFAVGQEVSVFGVADTSFNGTFNIVTVPSTTTFTYAQQGTLNATSGSGTATVATALGLVRAGNVVTATTTAAHGFQVGWSVGISGSTAVGLSGTITTIVRQGSVVTVTRNSSAQNPPAGSVVKIAGVTDATFNGTFTVTNAPSSSTFTYAQVLADATSSGGTVSDVFDSQSPGQFTIVTVPTTTTFTYNNIGPDDFTGNGTAAVVGNVSPGQRQVSVSFVTRQGYVTQPSPPVTFSAGGGSLVSLTNIPTGPANVTGRIVMFSAQIPAAATVTTAAMFYLPAMVINDNTTTSLLVDFTDTALQAGTSAATLFSKIELSECAGAIDYAGRTFWWGERNKLTNWVNLTFDGGWNIGATGPLGWTLDPTFGAGGSKESTLVVWGDAFKLTGSGVATVGKLTQGAFQDYNNVALIAPNTSYSVRARVRSGGGLLAGTLHINLNSASGGFTTAGLAVTAAQATATYKEFTAELIPKTQITGQTPSDLLLQLYADGTPTTGGFFIVDNVEIYPTNTPTNPSLLRASRAFDPETFDGVTGFLQVSPQDGQRVVTCFKIREFLYVVKERSMYVIRDDSSSEPSGWSVKEVSDRIGAAGINAVASGVDSALIVNRDGAYLFWGSEPIKVSQEITPATANPAPVFSWESINWTNGHTIWSTLDLRERRALIGAPYGSATSPNRVLYFDFRTTDKVEETAAAPPIHVSSFSGKLFAIAKGRKWAPWFITANSGALIERSDGTAHTFMGNGAGNGKVYDLLDSQLSDDGAAINSYYLTYFVPSVMLEQQLQMGGHVKLFTYLTLYVEGSGTLTMAAYGPGQIRSYTLPSFTLSSPPGIDQGYSVNIGEERTAFKFGTNAASSWFRMNRLILSVKQHPTIPVRGI